MLSELEAYQRLLDDKSYLDYSSILEEAVTFLTNDDDVRARLAERVKYVIWDEYQDVNPVQEAIVWSLHELGARICVVGNDDQTIYQWHGSDVENILAFDRRYPAIDQIPLEENFRSSERALRGRADQIGSKQGATFGIGRTASSIVFIGCADVGMTMFIPRVGRCSRRVPAPSTSTVVATRGFRYTDEVLSGYPDRRNRSS